MKKMYRKNAVLNGRTALLHIKTDLRTGTDAQLRPLVYALKPIVFPLIYWPVQHPFEGGLVHIELFLVFQNFVQEGAVLFIQIVVGQIVVGGEGLDVDILTGKLQTKSTLHYNSIQFTVIS